MSLMQGGESEEQLLRALGRCGLIPLRWPTGRLETGLFFTD
jgi:hypothetical protein